MSDLLSNPTGDGASSQETPQEQSQPEVSGSELVSKVGQAARLDRKRRERIVLYSVLGAMLALGMLGWLTEGRVFTSPWNALISLEAPGDAPRSAALNCRNPKNRNTPYCVERKARTKENWNGIVRNTDGRASQFTLHGGR